MRMIIQVVAIIAVGALTRSSQVLAEGLVPKSPSELVTVQTVTTSCPGGFGGARQIDSRLLSDGTTVTFTIPSGKVFVITDVGFHLVSRASQNINVRLGIPCGTGCMQPIIDTTVSTDTVGQGSVDITLRNGIAVKPGVVLCAADVNFSSPNAFARLHGYFTKDQ